MTGKDVETFQVNVRRCLESSSFTQDFYDRFTGTSDAIRDKFKNTDFGRQTQAMADSLYMMAVAVQGGPDNLARFDMKRLYTKHQHMGIRPEMYQTWFDCFIETARTHDPEFAPGVERAWRECLSPGIVAMRNRPRSPRVHLSQLFRKPGPLLAASDLQNIHDYIAKDSVTVARAVCGRLYDAVSQLGGFPDMGRPVPERPEPGLRELVRPPYRIVYEHRPDVVLVLTVFHAARMFPMAIREPAR